MEKIIHFCWFGGNKKPKKLKKYMKTWKKYLPEYSFMEWNEKNFDVNMCDFSKQAYENKKWAFVSDVARIYALYEYGGIYFDTDIEVIKNIDEILKNSMWLGKEDDKYIATAMIGVKDKHNKHIENILDMYKQASYNKDDLYSVTGPKLLTNYFEKYGLKQGNECQILEDDVHIYSKEYFNPKTYDGSNQKFTDNTCIVHHFDATWTDLDEKIAIWFVRRKMGFMAKYVFSLSNKLKKIRNKKKGE